MALAAALAATGNRPASFLPTITCSNCAQEIEIAAMGEHICTPAVTEPSVPKHRTSSMSNPFKLRKYDTAGESASLAQPETAGMRSNQSGSSRLPRIALPKINSDAANRAFLAPRDTGLTTPITPSLSAHSGNSNGKPQFSRSVTSPMPRLYDPRPPSPELTANLESAFPPFPTQAVVSGRSTPSNGRETPNGSDRAPSRAQNLELESSSVEPKSPGFMLQKFERLRTGPFTARRQGSGDSREEDNLEQKSSTVAAPAAPRAASPDSHPERSNLRLNTSSPGRHSPEVEQAGKKQPPPRPARLSYEQLSPVLLDRFSVEPDAMFPPQSAPVHHAHEHGAYPVPREPSHSHVPSKSLSTVRSEPALRLPERKASLPTADMPQAATSPRLDTVLPKRSSSRVGTRIDYRMQNAPPVPRPVQQHRKYSTHTPSESGSSTVSSANTYSSGPSPISSAASSVDPFSPLSMASNAQDVEEQIRSAGPSVRSQQKPGFRAELPPNRSPPRKFVRPSIDNTRKAERVYRAPLDSPMDPALHQLGAPYEPWQPITPDLATSPHAQFNSTADAYSPMYQPDTIPVPAYMTSPRSASPLSPPPVENQQRPSRPTPAKHTCRGCGLAIEGKSVKAADGRLTGRWHKSCFVCRTCVKPFATAEFYVINDNPYCEHHYHEKNGSLCNGCHRGIEGQYLETTSTTRLGSSEKKFHPRCFTCSTCHEVLSEDYFELSGKVLCERHALAILRQQQLRHGPRLDRRDIYAERRTTRLINPMMA